MANVEAKVATQKLRLLASRAEQLHIDSEAVLLGFDGRSDFNGLHSRKYNGKVQFYAFDVLMMEGEDLRQLPLDLRKNNLARLRARRQYLHLCATPARCR